jgi:hypothetical protein
VWQELFAEHDSHAPVFVVLIQAVVESIFMTMPSSVVKVSPVALPWFHHVKFDDFGKISYPKT